MAVEANDHKGTVFKVVILAHGGVAGVAGKVCMSLMTENQVSVICRFSSSLDLVILGRTFRCMAEKTLLRGLVDIDLVALLAVSHSGGSQIAVGIFFVALVTGGFLFDNVGAVAEFEAYRRFAGSQNQGTKGDCHKPNPE